LHLLFFFKFCFVLESKPSLYVQTTEGKIYKIQKLAKIQNRGFVKVFQTKNQKKTEKKRERK
jgi:hypothetical protein